MNDVIPITRKKPVLERTIENYLRDKCKAMGFMCIKLNPSGLVGIPDRMVIGNGRVVFVELKRPGGKPRPSQLAVHARMRECGADVRVIDNHADSMALIAEIAANPKELA